MDYINMPHSAVILGSTGSVGLQALDVARRHGIAVEMIAAGRDVATLENQIREFHPAICAVADAQAAKDLRVRVADTDTVVLSGESGICEGIMRAGSPVAVNAILGEAGLRPTLAVIDSGKRLALANKESLVIAGDIVRAHLEYKDTVLIPVDSEHSAIFQALRGSNSRELKRILLTASGGPFYGYTREMQKEVTLEMALAHPTWRMGKKITVDSATMMNKGFEVIEACHLFGVSADKIQVVVHPESIIHSAVEYIDNAVIAQMGVPDMRLCIQYAVSFPLRVEGDVEQLDLFKIGALTFKEPDLAAFPLLALAYRAIELGGAVPATLNAANEIAVAAFLSSRIRFFDIPEVVGETVHELEAVKSCTSLEDIIGADREARRIAAERVKETSLK